MHWQGNLFDQAFRPVKRKTRLRLGRSRPLCEIEPQVLAAAKSRCVSVELNHRTGTGVIIQTGLVFTNLHVVFTEPFNVRVNGKPAALLSWNYKKRDLAALLVETPEMPKLILSECKIGDEAIVVSLADGEPKHKQGRIRYASGLFVEVEGISGRDGTSGSAVYNRRGELIGILDEYYEGIAVVSCIPVILVEKFNQEVQDKLAVMGKVLL